MENDVAINNNLSANQIDRQFITTKRVFQLEHKHLWTKERLASHRTPQATPIIPYEMQTGEAHKHTSSLQQNLKCKLKG